MNRVGKISPWPQQEAAMWRKAAQILRMRGTETDPDEWIADAALQVAIVAAKLRYDLTGPTASDQWLLMAYRDVLTWMSRNGYNTNEHFRSALAQRMGLLGLRRKLR